MTCGKDLPVPTALSLPIAATLPACLLWVSHAGSLQLVVAGAEAGVLGWL